jgi:hypothetical protein
MGRCEVCHRHKENYDVPALFLKTPKTKEEIMLDKMVQEEYKKKSEALVIAQVIGPMAGATDYKATAELQQVFIRKNAEIDWFATFELRQKIQVQHAADERFKRDRI